MIELLGPILASFDAMQKQEEQRREKKPTGFEAFTDAQLAWKELQYQQAMKRSQGGLARIARERKRRKAKC